ncbi:MAG TPA: hypothetical protein VEW46_21565 [Pyrinomonadaceae bacterium]|nr:hypothetical protein [Pyrinomonadaceae bacterium]
MFRAVQSLLLITVMNAIAGGQEPPRATDVSPPPLKTISRLERSQIDEADDSKSRVKITLTLAETHLANAEARTSQNDFAGASAAMGKYWALIEDVFAFLKTHKPESNKTRDLYKRVELALRAQGPRLTAMRRSTPAEFSVWIKEIEDFARNGRTEALNSFYGHTVFREANPKPSSKQEGGPPQKTSGAKKP